VSALSYFEPYVGPLKMRAETERRSRADVTPYVTLTEWLATATGPINGKMAVF
jgi:hypothetical protein